MRDEEALDKRRQAGKAAGMARAFGKQLIKPGVLLIDVADKVEQKILDQGVGIGFPAQISRNATAAHYCSPPDDKTVFEKGDIVKLDVGAEVDGYIADTATTVNLGGHDKLVQASREALNNAIKLVRPGVTTGELGKVIGETIERFGFKPIRNLSGHGVGQYHVHTNPSIPNYGTGSKTTLEDGEVIAIEPFASTGAGLVSDLPDCDIFMQEQKRPVRNLITREVLREIEKYKGLPFTTRWLVRKFPLNKVHYALRDLHTQGVINNYPPLADRGNGLVSQAEHTIIVGEKPEVVTKADE
ncbi:type II methionyl aminopeptidase [Candidatus Woesearchaeota archaeon]|nr:type II methionyl aminopeptidase [Candidatus Woesearchaeota archaeon]